MSTPPLDSQPRLSASLRILRPDLAAKVLREAKGDVDAFYREAAFVATAVDASHPVDATDFVRLLAIAHRLEHALSEAIEYLSAD